MKSATAILGLFLTALVLPPVPAAASSFDGGQLQLYCHSQHPQDDAICVVYITGAVDAFTTMDLIAQKTEGAEPRFCVPDGVGPDDFRDITVSWLARPEANLDFSASLVVLSALEDAYGC